MIRDLNFKERDNVFIIAELSANHNGSIEIAIKTIKAAKRAGADAIKLQTYTADTLTLDCNRADFVIKGGSIWDGQKYYDLYKQAYTPWEWHQKLFDIAKEEGLVCFSSPFDKGAVDLLEELDNPIYKIGGVIDWFQQLTFDRVSDALGPVKLTVTQVSAGKQHNAVPADVKLVIDVRVNDLYSNMEIEQILAQAPCDVKARSLRLGSSSIPMNHALVQAGIAEGRETYGSPTLSDQAALSCDSLKLGPGDSLRSHTANEFIYVNEIEEAIPLYISILKQTL